MKYNLGDFVRFVDEKMEGYVTRIIDVQMIGVTGEDDFEIPVLASKVTTVHGHHQQVAKQEVELAIATVTNNQFKTTGIYLAMVNDAKASSVIHFYLLNETSFQLLVTLTTEQSHLYKGVFNAIIKPGAFEKIYSAQLADLQVWPTFMLQLLYFTINNVKPLNPINFVEKFKAKDFSEPKKQITTLNQLGWLIQIDEPLPIIDTQKLKESFFKTKEEKIEIEKPKSEIDLHIEVLRNDYQFLGSSEILSIQLEVFQKSLEAAIVHKFTEIIFIHGAGSGVLKYELQKILSKHQKVQTFMDARKEKFGYGATKVVLK